MWDCLVRSEDELGFTPVPIPEARTKIGGLAKQSYYYDYIKDIRLSIPLILVGGHRNIERMEEIAQNGNADFLSLCRPLISEPDLPNRWLHGEGLTRADCISCNACLLVLRKEFCCPYKKYGKLKELYLATNAENWRRPSSRHQARPVTEMPECLSLFIGFRLFCIHGRMSMTTLLVNVK